jgi:hypothetical protein
MSKMRYKADPADRPANTKEAIAKGICRIETFDVAMVTCPKCGILYGTLDAFFEDAWNEGRAFHCPNGHRSVFPKSTGYKNKNGILTGAKELPDAEDGETSDEPTFPRLAEGSAHV